jgi:4-amino-4-deoxy-L-arabinose transferase-like glycosyltransferase
VFGFNEFAARFPSFLLGMITVFLTFLLGLQLRGSLFGLTAALILASIGLFFIGSGSVMTDPALLASVTLSMVSFYFVFSSEEKKFREIWRALFFIGLGLSFIAKGPLGWVLIAGPIIVWAIVHHQGKNVFNNFFRVTSILLMLMIALPWYVLAEMKTPGFLRYFFIEEHWLRFTVSGWKGDLYGNAHASPRGMILLWAIPATMPWCIIFIQRIVHLFKRGSLREQLEGNIGVSYLLIWAIFPFIIFMFASNTLITYVSPALPAFALITAVLLDSTKGVENVSLRKVILPTALVVPVGFLIVAMTILPRIGWNHSQAATVKTFLALSKDDRGSLVYWGELPYSAEFYGQGRVIAFKLEDEAALEREMSDSDEDFFVISDQHQQRMPPAMLNKTVELGRFHKATLRKEFKS